MPQESVALQIYQCCFRNLEAHSTAKYATDELAPELVFRHSCPVMRTVFNEFYRRTDIINRPFEGTRRHAADDFACIANR